MALVNDASTPSLDAMLRSLFVTHIPDKIEGGAGYFVDAARLRAAFVSAGLCGSSASDLVVVSLYINCASCRAASPSAMFDEAFYLQKYVDVAAAVGSGFPMSGFHHFINYGITEGRWPNGAMETAAAAVAESPPVEALDFDAYLRLNESAREFIDAFPWLDPLLHYNMYGRRLGLRTHDDPVAAEFDAEFYRAAYMAELEPSRPAYAHYTEVGAGRGASPNGWFDEGWYCAFYADVRDAVAVGVFTSGFQHYVLVGRGEGRHPAYDLTQALEARLPGVTEPRLLWRVDGLRRKLGMFDVTPPLAMAAGGAARVWFIVPILNPDIAFGGYQTAFALMVQLHQAGFLLGIYCMEEENPNLGYFVWRQSSPAVRAAFGSCLVVGSGGLESLPLRSGDRVLAYSVWGLPLAAKLSNLSGAGEPFLLAQEYEPIFYENDAMRVLCESFYDVPHVPIINSAFLLKYFRAHRVGPFAESSVRNDGFVCFEPRINRFALQSPERLARRAERTLMVYSRPESHAGRNLFELVVLVLERLCCDGAFGPEWSFIGLGALSDLPDVPLGPRHVLRLVKKMDEADYIAAVGATDIAISLMCAPHPSLMPFELATVGALVVTNVYENRTADELRAICANIVPCALSIGGVTEALHEALARVADVDARHAAAFRPMVTGWHQIFTPAVLQATFGLPDSEEATAAEWDQPRPAARATNGRGKVSALPGRRNGGVAAAT